jgi:hypothetical protein
MAPEFLQGTKPDADFDTDEAPLIVFINARSGGGMGPKLAGVLARALGSSQVCACVWLRQAAWSLLAKASLPC